MEAESLDLKPKPQIENQRQKARPEAASQERKSTPKAETATLTQPPSFNRKFKEKNPKKKYLGWFPDLAVGEGGDEK